MNDWHKKSRRRLNPRLIKDDGRQSVAKYPDIVAELASGAKVRVRAGRFTENIDYSACIEPARPRKVLEIRVYSTEDSRYGRWRNLYAFKAERDFDRSGLPQAWNRIRTLAGSREFFDYDSVDEFITDTDAILCRTMYAVEDAFDHYTGLRPIRHRPDVDLDDDAIYTDAQD
jgi:hypothetical protein